MSLNQELQKYNKRKGLEGPFDFSGRILYFDPVENLHYDPRTDFYVYPEEMVAIHARIIEILSKTA